MRWRLKNFLPIILVALAVQIFAPIAACWAASVAASDPLSAAVICHGNGGAAEASQDDPSGSQGAQRTCCSLCGVLNTGAPVDPPQTAAVVTIERQITRVVWHALVFELTASRAGSPEQARAPPVLT